MRQLPLISHQDIIKRSGGIAKLARLIEVDPNTAKRWKRLNSIPGKYWLIIACRTQTTLEELAMANAYQPSGISDADD